MAAFKKFVSSFRTAARLHPPPALIVERRVAHPRNNRFITMERFYSELKYIVSTRVALAGAAVIVNQELTKAKIEGVVMEVARMGQRVDRMVEKLEEMEKKMGQRVDRMVEKLEEMEKKMGQRVDRMVEKLEEMEKKMGQRVDRMEEKLEKMEKKMDQKFDQMEQKMDKLLIQQFVLNAWPWSHGRR